MAEPLIDRIIRREGWLDGVGDFAQAAVRRSYRSLGPLGPGLRDLLHGSRGLGHPLHPALTDLPLGAWTVGVVMDYVAHFTTAIGPQAGDIALAIGLVTSLPAIASGLTDSQDTYGHERRANMLHGLTMTLAVLLLAVSLGLRWWAGFGLHPLAVGLATAGLVVAMAGMYVGGHLTFAIGTMVNRSAFLSGPADFVSLGASGDFPEGTLRRVDAGGLPVLVVRRGGQLYAMGAVCSHAGGPLEAGELNGDIVTCPWHGSRFDVRSGRVRRGPATFGQPRLIVRETGGRAEAKLEHPLQ